MTVFGDVPGSVTQLLPAASVSTRSPSSATLPRNHSRASRHTGPHARRCAPSAVPVRDASSRNSAMTRCAFIVLCSAPPSPVQLHPRNHETKKPRKTLCTKASSWLRFFRVFVFSCFRVFVFSCFRVFVFSWCCWVSRGEQYTHRHAGVYDGSTNSVRARHRRDLSVRCGCSNPTHHTSRDVRVRRQGPHDSRRHHRRRQRQDRRRQER